MNDNHDIDQLFKRGLEGFAPAPPAQGWDRVAKELAAQKRSKRRMVIWWRSAASVALLLALAGSWFLWQPLQTSKPLVAVSEEVASDVNQLDEPATASLSVVERLDKKELEPLDAAETPEEPPLIAQPVLVAQHGNSRRVTEETRFSVVSRRAIQGLSSLVSRKESIAGEFSVVSVSVKPLATQVEEQRKREFTESLLLASAYPKASVEASRPGVDFVLGGMASPSFSHHAQSRIKSEARMAQSNEEGVLTMGGGLNLRIETKSRWSFESGVLYSRIGQSEKSDGRPPLLMASASGVVADASMLTHRNSLGAIKVKSSGLENVAQDMGISYVPQRYGGYQGDIRQILDYVEVPFLARYRLVDRQLDLSVTGGFSANFLADNNAFMFDGGKKTYVGYTQGMDAFSVSSSLGLNLEVPIFKSLSFNMEPRFKYFITPVNSDTGYTPYSFSMLAGFAIHF